MGYADIPPNPAGAGQLHCELELNRDELTRTVALLKTIAARMAGSRGSAVAASPAGPPDSAQALGAGLRSLSLSAGSVAAPATPATASPALRTASVASTGLPAQPAMPQPAISQPVMPQPVMSAPMPVPMQAPRPQQPAPFAPQPMPAVSAAPYAAAPMPAAPMPRAPVMAPPAMQPAAPPPPQPVIRQPPVQQQQPQRPPQPAIPQVAAPVRQAPAPATAAAQRAPAAPSLPSWEVVWQTDELDHNREPVHALSYCPSLEGLPGGDGHAGWLISSSRHTLNLWEASPGGRTGVQHSLMCMHSQATDLLSTHLAVEPSWGTMFAVSVDTGSGTECLSVHSLKPESLLAYKYRILPPGAGIGASGAAAAGGRPGAAQAQQQQRRGLSRVVSLHTLGRFLRNHVVASYGPNVLLFEVPPGGASAPMQQALGLAPKKQWRAVPESAGATTVSALSATSLSGGLLLTGHSDGGIGVWNLVERPGANVRSLKAPKQVTALSLVNDTTLATACADGKVLLWDMRKPTQPMRTVSPDGSAALHLEVSPAADCVAVSTAKGLYAVDLLDGGGTVTPITQQPLPRPYHAITWNWATSEIYAAGAGGAITVYRQRGF